MANATMLVIGLVGTAVVEPTSDGEGPVAATAGGPEGSPGSTDSTEPTVPGATEAAPKGDSASSRKASRQATRMASTTTQQPTATVQAPADGTYKRRVDWTFEQPVHKKGGGETATRISTTARSVAEVRQHHETTMTSTDDENDGRPASGLGPRDIRWTASGMFSIQAKGADGSKSCEPAETLELQLPLVAGARWTTTAVCTYERRGGGRATSRTETVSEVTGAREVDFAGKLRSVWEIVADSKSTVDGQSTGATTKATILFSPELGVDLRTDTTVTVSSYFGYTSTSRLLDIALG